MRRQELFAAASPSRTDALEGCRHVATLQCPRQTLTVRGGAKTGGEKDS